MPYLITRIDPSVKHDEILPKRKTITASRGYFNQ